jgi:hypothetical protein
MTSGKRRTRAWKLRFERRTAPVIEPLMGWSGSDDPLMQVELSFPSAQAAIAYARKQGLQYTVLSPSRGDMMQGPSPARSAFTERRLRLEWVERTLGPDVIRNGFGPGLDPAVCYADPQDVLRDPELDPAQKREVLHRWALDAYLLELAYSKGEPQAQLSRLQEVIDALIDLGQPASTSPAL